MSQANSVFEYWSSGSFGSGTVLGCQVYRMLFSDNDDVEGSMIRLRFILMIRVKRKKSVLRYKVRIEDRKAPGL